MFFSKSDNKDDPTAYLQEFICLQALIFMAALTNKPTEAYQAALEACAKNLHQPELASAEISEQSILGSLQNITKPLLFLKKLCQEALEPDGVLNDAEVLFLGRVARTLHIDLERVEQICDWLIDEKILAERAHLIFESEEDDEHEFSN